MWKRLIGRLIRGAIADRHAIRRFIKESLVVRNYNAQPSVGCKLKISRRHALASASFAIDSRSQWLLREAAVTVILCHLELQARAGRRGIQGKNSVWLNSRLMKYPRCQQAAFVRVVAA
jgi:hypothetical protein